MFRKNIATWGGGAGEALLALTCGCELAARLCGSAAAPRCEGGTALSANAGAAVGRAALAAASAAGGHSRPSGAAKAAESLKDSTLRTSPQVFRRLSNTAEGAVVTFLVELCGFIDVELPTMSQKVVILEHFEQLVHRVQRGDRVL